jgi:methylated-DNA-[protein]-cysteine S-methyltransferase
VTTATVARLTLETPIGPLSLVEEDGCMVAIDWRRQAGFGTPTPLLLEAKRQLLEYFDGRRRQFDLALRPSGPPFEQSVWALMSTIPYGETRSYGDLARPLAATPQDIGQACGRNPLPIVIPCHRVLAADGRLGGYSGGKGTETKRRLLVLEGALLV